MILSQYQQKFEQCCFVVACCVLPCDKGNAVETKKRMRTAVILQSTFFFFPKWPHPAHAFITSLCLLQVWGSLCTCHHTDYITASVAGGGSPNHSYHHPTCHHTEYVCCHCWIQFTPVTTGIRSAVDVGSSPHLSPH